MACHRRVALGAVHRIVDINLYAFRFIGVEGYDQMFEGYVLLPLGVNHDSLITVCDG